MAVRCVSNHFWTRKHDKKSVPLFAAVPRTCFPVTLADLIEICSTRAPSNRLHAAGGHWGLSEAAFSDHTFIETHDPGGARPVMGATLTNVVPACMSQSYLDWLDAWTKQPEARLFNLIHVEAGKRIYQLYSELDDPVDMATDKTLGGYLKKHYGNHKLGGSWAPFTLGSAGGQTIVGALNTGTHGGDFDRPPLADAVQAIHLVADGGKHYWIEPLSTKLRGFGSPQLTDDEKLKDEYAKLELGGPGNFEIIRDNDMFNAVLVSAGRFGVIYSVVLAATPQHHLYERRRLHLWQDVKHDIKNRYGPLFADAPTGWDPDKFQPSSPPEPNQRFLQIVVCLTPHLGFARNLVGITKRWDINTMPPEPYGRAHRVGTRLSDLHPILRAPRYANAGRNTGFNYDPSKPGMQGDPTLLQRACSNASFMIGLLETILDELEEFITTQGGAAGAILVSVLVPGGAGAVLLIPILRRLWPIIKAFADALGLNDTLGDAMNRLRELLLDPDDPDPLRRAAGVLVWQMVAYGAFSLMQGDADGEAISYAIMDTHEYKQLSCDVNVDSIEVFFDAADDRLIAYIDALINFEIMQEFAGKAFLGYASLRFTGPSRALLGEQRHFTSCAVEVSCLRDMEGSQEMVDYASELALNPNFNGILHWGQRNDSNRAQIEARFGASLAIWRRQLARITEGGRLDGFSNEFSRRTGLEVS
jgi:hypothetical protein